MVVTGVRVVVVVMGSIVADAVDVTAVMDGTVDAPVWSSSPQATPMMAHTPRSATRAAFLRVCVTETGLGTRLR